MTITPDQVRRNAFTENLGSDWIAVDAEGRVMVRADSRETAERACPHAAGFFTGADLPFSDAPQPIDKAAMSPIEAAFEQIRNDSVEKTPVADPFDHDGDGKPGGSPKGGNRRKKQA